jgi:hypothetical protein
MKKHIISFLFLLSVVAVNAQNDRTTILQNLEKNQPADQEMAMTATMKSASRLFGDKNDLTSVILVIPSGSVVDILGSDSTYFNVVFEDNEGYILKRHAVINETPVAPQPMAQKPVEPVQQTQQDQQQQQVSRFTYLENKYGSSLASKIISGKIWKGMSSEMVRDSWGSPLKINRVISGNTIKEEWIYKNTWLYIQDDYLAEWGAIK